MKLKRGKLLVDPPTSASSDIAFILIIFFLVCASVQPETGLGQNLPKAEIEPEKPNQSQNLEVSITPSSILINGNPMQLDAFRTRIATELAKKNREADKVVVVKSAPETKYEQWVAASQAIDEAGGTLTLEIEVKETITLD